MMVRLAWMLACACTLLSALPAVGQGSMSPAYFMCFRPMTDAAPAADLPAFRLLERAKMVEAGAAFRKRLAAQPADLAAYLGLLQSDPRLVASAARARRGPAWVDRAKGALAVYSQWRLAWVRSRRQRGAGPSNQGIRDEAVKRLGDVWKEKNDLVVGFALGDADVCDTYGPRQSLLGDMLSPAARALRWKALRSGGKGKPPAVGLIAKQNRRALRGLLVIDMRWEEGMASNVVPSTGRPSGRPTNPEQVGHRGMARYDQAWIKALDKDLGDKAMKPYVWPPPESWR